MARMHTKNILKYHWIGRYDKIVEIGCNKGYLVVELMRFSDYVYGLDIDHSIAPLFFHSSTPSV